MNNFKIFHEPHTFCYFQLLYPFVQKHPAHTLLPFVNLHGQEAFERIYNPIFALKIFQKCVLGQKSNAKL